MTQTKTTVCKDAWMGEQIGREAYHLLLNPEDDTDQLRKVLDFFKEDHRGQSLFLYTKVAVHEVSKITLLEQAEFRLIDTNMTYSKKNTASKRQELRTGVRFATAADENAVVEVARTSFKYSRFHLDPCFSKVTADHVKGEWVRNYFKGKRGDQMILAENDAGIIGFLQLIKRDDTCVIDLIAVCDKARGQGWASAMISFAEIKNQATSQFIVGTQIANIQAVKLYEKMGYRLRDTKYIFHYHQL